MRVMKHFNHVLSWATGERRGRAVASATLLPLLFVTACTRTVEPLQSAAPLPPAPAGNVQQQSLEPVPGDGSTDLAGTQNQDPNQPLPGTTDPNATQTQVAAVQPKPVPTASNKPIDRGSVAGVWDVATPAGSCKFATSFTRRSQHYQASALRCPNQELTNVREWDVSGSQLVLYDSSGAAVARLFKTGAQRFDGKTTSGSSITFSRS